MKQIYRLLTLILLLSTVTLLADPPYATNLSISGLVTVGQKVTGSYTYGDIDGDLEDTTAVAYRWFISDNSDGTGTPTNVGTSPSYTISGNVGKYINFGVIVEAATNNGSGGGTTGVEVIVNSATAIVANQAPTATNVYFTGSLSYGDTLTGFYTYSDAEGDSEDGGSTTFKWKMSSSSDGSGAVDAPGTNTGSTYIVPSGAIGNYIGFSVQPHATAGTLSGNDIVSGFQGAVVNNHAPTASGLTISGNPNNGQTLTANFVFSDTENDPAGTHLYQWYTANDASGSGEVTSTGTGATTSSYIVAVADTGKWVRFKVTPVASKGTFTGTMVSSNYVFVTNDPPTIDPPTISGTLQAGSTLTADPQLASYNDLDGDGAGTHLYQWYRSDNASGTNKSAISGATTVAYVLKNADVGKYISFKTTPKASAGVTTGDPVESALSGPILSYPLAFVTLTAPTNGATDQTLTPSLQWTEGGGAATENKYQIQVSTNSLFVSPYHDVTVAYTTGTETYVYSGPALSYNAKYYWRVRALDDSGAETYYSPWSTIWSFTTVADITPVLSYPIATATVYTASPTLYWYNSAYVVGLTYDVEVDDGGGWSTVASGIGSTNFTLTNLTPGQSYDWRVTANKGALSETSAVEDFTVDNSVAGAAIVPQPSFPIGGVAVYTLTPSLHWYLGTYASGLTYTVEVATDNAFTSVVYTASGISTLSTTTTPLSPITTYYWRVNSDNGSSTSGWSATSTFITTASASGSVVTPVPSWPVGGPMVYSTTPTLNWYLGTYATGLTYNVQVATDVAFTSVVYTVSSISALYHAVTTPLSEATTYYWRVQSDNGSSQSSWSPANSFTVYSSSVSTGINTPILTYPVGGATLINNAPTLFWYCIGANSSYTYELKYSLYPDLTSGTTETGLTDNFKTLSGLVNGVTYYWSVRAYDGSNYSDWATTESFVTPPTTSSPIVVPNPGTPTAGVTVENNPQLSWFLPTATSAVTYDLQVSTDLNFVDNTAEVKNISASSMSLQDLEAGKTYFWRVRTRDAEGEVSFYSQSAQFVVNSVTDVEKLDQIPTEFGVAQNYPNPFNPETTIRYSIPEASYVTIKVYNTLGQEVRTLINNDVNAGVYNVRWNGEDNFGSKVSSGTYIYRVTAGSKVFTKKMILLK